MDLSKLILCDVLCGGNVSPVFFKDYLKYIEKKQKDKVTDICFRTKIIGWKQHHILINLEKLYIRELGAIMNPSFTYI